MASAVFEALFDGSEEFEFEAGPTAVVLWVTDDPNLNEQTRFRIIEASEPVTLPAAAPRARRGKSK